MGRITGSALRLRSRGYFIQSAIKKPGSLRRFAEDRGFITQRGTIDLDRTEHYIRSSMSGHERKVWLAKVNLARRLRSFH